MALDVVDNGISTAVGNHAFVCFDMISRARRRKRTAMLNRPKMLL